MRLPILVATSVAFSVSLSAQCELYYKFDRGVGDTAVNYGTAAVESKIMSMTTAPWAAAGQHGGSLQGSANTSTTDYVYCDTGWNAAVATDFTVSWWSKQRVVPGTALSYVFSGKGSFRCFTNGVAGTELWCRAWGGVDLKLPTVGGTFQTRAAAATGVSVALVVDATNKSAQWYVDGAAHGAAIPLVAAVAIPAGNFIIGKHTSDSSSFAYDVDEFRFCSRAATAAEIKAWHSLPHAAAGHLGKDCGIVMAGKGAPTEGNALFALDFKSAAAFRYLFVAGVKPLAGFDMGVAFPAVAGCTWYTEFFIQITGSSPGSTSLPVPIPNGAAGAAVEAQILGFDTAGKAMMSNAVSIKVEKQ